MASQITFRCETENAIASAVLDKAKTRTFTCDVCKLRMFFDPVKLTIGANGHTDQTIKHRILSVKEIGVTTT